MVAMPPRDEFEALMQKLRAASGGPGAKPAKDPIPPGATRAERIAEMAVFLQVAARTFADVGFGMSKLAAEEAADALAQDPAVKDSLTLKALRRLMEGRKP